MSLDLVKLLLRESLAGPGLWYLVPVPDGPEVKWELVAFGYDEYGDDSGHAELWLDYVAPVVAASWARRKRRPSQLEDELADLDHAFPRGRITPRLEHLHGGGTEALGWSLDRVEQRFGLGGKCRRQIDPHEVCDARQRENARALLGLSVSWLAR